MGRLSLYGINGPILCWIEAFLTDRVQGVVVEGFRSPEGTVLSGVPQSTVLGPLLFLLHINDLSVITSQIRLFADDCLIYRPIRSSADCEALQRDLDSLERWSSACGMKFNTKNVKLCSSPVGSHILPICITYVVTYCPVAR